MVFTVHPADAQAIQEDEAQLLGAIAAATRGLMAELHHQSQPTHSVQPETLRIQMGRRLVYGSMANGQFRNELDADRLKAIFDALQRPVTTEINPEDYRGKIPAIEIRDGDTILFREERDGTVTVNDIQFQLQQQSQQPTQSELPSPEQIEPPETSTGEHELPQLSTRAEQPQDVAEFEMVTSTEPIRLAEKGDSTTDIEPLATISNNDRVIQEDLDWKVEDVAQTAEYLINPLGNDKPIYDAVAVGGYQISWNGNGITVARGNDLILTAQEGQVTDSGVTQQDWEYFQTLQLQALSQNSRSIADTDSSPSINGDQVILTADVAEASDPQDTLPAIAVAEREAARLPAGSTKELLQTHVQDWKQQALQHVQQGLRQGIDWLASRPEAIRNQQIARATLDLFNRGYERTGEKSYRVGDYTIRLQGQNLYTLSDARGRLISFKASKVPIPGLNHQSIQIVATSPNLGRFEQNALLRMQQDRTVTPQGDLDTEATYAAKTVKVERTVRQFLQNQVRANVWDREGGRFRFEMGEGFTRITDKQGGRGVVFERSQGAVFSRLGAGDFAHFDRLAAKIQSVDLQRPPPAQKSWVQRRGVGMELG